MKRGRLAIQILFVFAFCLAGYVALFRWIEQRRVAKGPWRVEFTNDAGRPALDVNQATLNLRDIRIIFLGTPPTTNTSKTVEFAEARKVPFDLPYGQCLFQDTLYQPGTVALKVFDHQIQLMPRVLTIDGVERPWRSGERIELSNVSTNSVR